MIGNSPLNILAIANVKLVLRWAIEEIDVMHSLSFYQSEMVRGKGVSGAPASHELTGGEYKTQEHIHRDVADSRLLAIPTS